MKIKSICFINSSSILTINNIDRWAFLIYHYLFNNDGQRVTALILKEKHSTKNKPERT